MIPLAEEAHKPIEERQTVMDEDIALPFDLPAVARKKVSAAFDGGRITSDGGVMLLAQAERRLGIADQLAREIPDERDADRVVHLLPDICALGSSPSPAATRTPTILIGCGSTRRSSWPAGGYPIPAAI